MTEVPRAILRLAGALAVYAALRAAPWPSGLTHWVALGASAALATTILIICGTLLYDTLFYERHWRQVDAPPGPRG